jgi:hypothetical protein
MHPSELGVGQTGDAARVVVQADTQVVLGSFDNVTYVKSPMMNDEAGVVALAASGHHYGYGQCHWIRHCASADRIGAPCQAILSNVTYDGYCYESASKTMECGAMTQMSDKFNLNVVSLEHPSVGYHLAASHQVPYRCPRFSTGTFNGPLSTTPRLLAAGCMIPTDANYSSFAEVHVPVYCSAPADYEKGCMFPAATNFVPTAKQASLCTYNTLGCTSSTALNYNYEANIDDGSCIEAIYGCTINSDSYHAVNSETPGYESDFTGQPWRAVGKVATPDAITVLNYNSNANAIPDQGDRSLTLAPGTSGNLMGCILAIEGCMDSTAVNYDSDANINTNTWCVPPIVGCMMPATTNPNPLFLAPAVPNPQPYAGAVESRVHTRDGLALTFDPAATVYNKDMCEVMRYGCMDSLAANYDPHATYNYQCYPVLEGCLNKHALNFGCSVQQITSCTNTTRSEALTGHSKTVCIWKVSPPSPPPPAPYPRRPGVQISTVHKAEVTYIAAGVVDDYPTSKRQELCGKLTAVITTGGVEDCVTTVEPASVLLTSTFTTSSLETNQQAISLLQAALADAASASALLGIPVQATPVVGDASVYTVLAPPPSPPPGYDWGPVVGGIVGALIGVLVLGAVLYVFKKRAMSKVEA